MTLGELPVPADGWIELGDGFSARRVDSTRPGTGAYFARLPNPERVLSVWRNLTRGARANLGWALDSDNVADVLALAARGETPQAWPTIGQRGLL